MSTLAPLVREASSGRAGEVSNSISSPASSTSSPGASVPDARRAASKRSEPRMPCAICPAIRARTSTSRWENAPLTSRRATCSAPQTRPSNDERGTELVRNARGLQQHAIARAGSRWPRVACARVATGTRRRASCANVFASSTTYSLRITSSPAACTLSGVKMPRSTSSAGWSLVSSRVCGSSVCQQVASLSTTRRSRGATSAKYSCRGRPRLPRTASSSWRRSSDQLGSRIRRLSPFGGVGEISPLPGDGQRRRPGAVSAEVAFTHRQANRRN